MEVIWSDSNHDSLAYHSSVSDPLGQRVRAVVELRLGKWWAHISDVMDTQVASREEGKALVEATFRLRGELW